MKYCRDCVGFDDCKATARTVEFAVDDGVCIDFDECKPQTNADRIRSMSDFELAKEIENAQSGIEIKNPKNIDYFDCILEWLQQPAE